MNCFECQELLSAYHDGELADNARMCMKEHLDVCSRCARELGGFETLSALASTSTMPAPMENIWTQLESQLEIRRGGVSAMRERRWRLPGPRLVALVAGVVLLVGLGWVAYRTWLAPAENHHLAVDFSHYIAEFQTDPVAAHESLVARHAGQAMNAEAALDRLGYRPAVADGLPEGYTLAAGHVMKMPCCTCVGCLCRRPDGSSVSIFEHDEAQHAWFGDRPAISATCGGKYCRLVQLDGRLAASWKSGSRYITLIGATDVEEVNQLVAWFDRRRGIQPQ